jgi:hypothetical protein
MNVPAWAAKNASPKKTYTGHFTPQEIRDTRSVSSRSRILQKDS